MARSAFSRLQSRPWTRCEILLHIRVCQVVVLSIPFYNCYFYPSDERVYNLDGGRAAVPQWVRNLYF